MPTLPPLPALHARSPVPDEGFVAVPSTYGGQHSSPSPGIVVAIVLGSVVGFLLILLIIYSALGFGPIVLPGRGGGGAATVTEYSASVMSFSRSKKSAKSVKSAKRSSGRRRSGRVTETFEVRQMDDTIIVEEEEEVRRPRRYPPPPRSQAAPRVVVEPRRQASSRGPPPPRMVSEISSSESDDDEVVVIEENTPPRRRSRRPRSRSTRSRSTRSRNTRITDDRGSYRDVDPPVRMVRSPSTRRYSSDESD